MNQDSPITLAGRAAAKKLEDYHFERVADLLRAHELYEDGVEFSEKWLEGKGYLISQVMLPGNQYRLVLAKIVASVEYKAEVTFDLEVHDMPDTTMEDTPERRAKRKVETEPEPEEIPTEPPEDRPEE